jgi:hypothetical protein
MKIAMTKNGQTRWCQDHEQQLLESAGWRPADQEQVREEVIRLRPAVKPKATVRVLEEANINKGDE